MDVTRGECSGADHPKSAPSMHFGAGRLIGSGVVWIIIALLTSFIASALLNFLIGLGTASMHIPLPLTWYRDNAALFRLASGIGLQCVLLASSFRLGRLVGNGDRAAGLEMNPIRRPILVSGLIALLLCCQIGIVELARHLGPNAPAIPGPVHVVSGIQLAELGLQFVLFVALAPIAEELFFRGWLWVGLQRVWGTAPVTIVTAMAWLGLHFPDGLYRPVVLIPTAVLLTSIRYVGSSVRASIAGHLAVNSLLVAWHIIEL